MRRCFARFIVFFGLKKWLAMIVDVLQFEVPVDRLEIEEQSTGYPTRPFSFRSDPTYTPTNISSKSLS
jgi:hypothetical protein